MLRVLVALACVTPGAALAGAWSRDLGHLYVKLGGSFFDASGATPLGGRGGTELRAEFASEYYALYAEIGLGGGAQIAVSLPYARNSNRYGDGTVARREGLADLGVLVAYGTRRGPWAVSFGAGALLPLYDRRDEVPAGAPLPREPELGDGRYDLNLVVTIGRSFWPDPAWFELEVGHRLRVGELTGGFLASLRGGYTIAGRLLLMAEVRTLRAYGVSDAVNPVVRPPDLLVLEPKLAFFFGAGLALEVSVGTAVPGASRDPGVFLGAAVSFTR